MIDLLSKIGIIAYVGVLVWIAVEIYYGENLLSELKSHRTHFRTGVSIYAVLIFVEYSYYAFNYIEAAQGKAELALGLSLWYFSLICSGLAYYALTKAYDLVLAVGNRYYEH